MAVGAAIAGIPTTTTTLQSTFEVLSRLTSAVDTPLLCLAVVLSSRALLPSLAIAICIAVWTISWTSFTSLAVRAVEESFRTFCASSASFVEKIASGALGAFLAVPHSASTTRFAGFSVEELISRALLAQSCALIFSKAVFTPVTGIRIFTAITTLVARLAQSAIRVVIELRGAGSTGNAVPDVRGRTGDTGAYDGVVVAARAAKSGC